MLNKVRHRVGRIWEWFGTTENYQAIAAIFTILTLGAVIWFGILGVRKVDDISINLREIKADIVEAGEVKTNSIGGNGWRIQGATQ